MSAKNKILRSKYTQIKEAMGDFVQSYTNKMKTGRTDARSQQVFLVLSMWMSYLKEKIPFKDAVTIKAPRDLQVKLTPRDNVFDYITLSVEDKYGNLVPISNIEYEANAGETADEVVSRLVNAHLNTGILLSSVGDVITVKFPAGTLYNGARLLADGAIIADPHTPTSGGKDGTTEGILTAEEIVDIEKILDKIAIELSVSFKASEELSASFYSQTPNNELTTSNNLEVGTESLTSESGEPLELD